MTFPIEALQQHIAIVGKTGSGKTYAAKGLVEGLLEAKRRVCILDPTGAWYGLRSSADGKRAGYPVAVFGGAHGDVPIAERSGATLAHILAEKNLPAIIDLSEMLIGQRHRFVTDFAEAIYRENKSPLHLIIDEADEFIPQNPMPETKRLLHHIDRIIRRGRIKGFRVMMITQRPAVIHKNALTQANTLVVMRLTAPQDRKAIQAWIEGNADAATGKRVLESLAGMARGEGWVWSPELDVLEQMKFPRIRTFDSSRSPEDDETLIEPTKLADVDLGEIKKSFEAVEHEAKTLVDLQAEVAKLKRDLAAAEKRATAQAARPVPNNSRNILREGPSPHDLTVRDVALEKIVGIALKALGIEKKNTGSQAALPAATDPVRARSVPQHSARPAAAVASAASATGLPNGEQVVLTAIAQHPDGVTREQLTVLTGYKRSTRDAYIQRMRKRGVIETQGERIHATDAGFAALGAGFTPLPTGRALAEHWLEKLPEGESRILRILIDNQPNWISREQVGSLTDYARSSRDAYLQRLKARQLIRVDRGMVAASENLS